MKSRLECLRDWLNFQLLESQKIIQLLQDIQSREAKLATPSEVSEITNFQDSKLCEAFPDLIIALVLESKTRKRIKKGIIYQPFLLINDDTFAVRQFLSLLETYLRGSTPFHFDIIVKSGAHCTAVQLDFNSKDFRVFYIDASRIKLNESFLDQLYFLDPLGTFNVANLAMQHDEKNCAIFSMQHLNNLSYHSSGIGHSEQLSRDGTFFGNLPAVFFKHSQKALSLNDDLHKEQCIHKRSTHTLQDHLNQYSIMVEAAGVSDGVRVKKSRNYSILFKRHKYLQVAIDELNLLETNLNSSEIENRLYARMNFEDKNIAPVDVPTKCLNKPHEHVNHIDDTLSGIEETHDDERRLFHQAIFKSPSPVMKASINLGIELNYLIDSDEKKQEIFETGRNVILEPARYAKKCEVLAEKLYNNKNTKEVGLGLMWLGITVTLTGLILNACSKNNLTQAIQAIGVVMIISGYVLDHIEDSTPIEIEESYEDDQATKSNPSSRR